MGQEVSPWAAAFLLAVSGLPAEDQQSVTSRGKSDVTGKGTARITARG